MLWEVLGMKEIGKYGGWEGRGVCVCACVYITFIEEPEKKTSSLVDKGIHKIGGEEAVGLFYMQLVTAEGY